MRYVDRDAAILLLRRIVDRIERPEFAMPQKGTVLRDRRRQSRLAVVNVPHRPHVHVRLRPLKFLLRHKMPSP
jgi:hypothetical protein